MSTADARLDPADGPPAEGAGAAVTGAPRGPFRAPQPHLRWLERTLERGLGLEHGANIFPLLHIALYYSVFVALVAGWVTSPWLVVPLWVAMVLLNYSLSIGILHLHAHRKLFTWTLANRAVELLLCLPCALSFPVMKYIHVYLHHKFSDGEGDPTTTKGFETGWRAVWYWLRYPYVCHRATLAG
ncbi:MAG TPA: fatty acid desaturase, partial [Gemmata sp.]